MGYPSERQSAAFQPGHFPLAAPARQPRTLNMSPKAPSLKIELRSLISLENRHAGFLLILKCIWKAKCLVLKALGDQQINDGTQKPRLMLPLSCPQLAFLTLNALAAVSFPAVRLLLNREPAQSSGVKATRSKSYSKWVSDKRLISKAVQRIFFFSSLQSAMRENDANEIPQGRVAFCNI